MSISSVNGFIDSEGVANVYSAGGGEWEAQIGGAGIVYTHPEYGKLRICPDLWARLVETATGRPTTLNHSATKNGIVTKMWVDDDGRPWARWIVNQETNEMMGAEDWTGGVSPSIIPLKIIKDDTAVADGIVVEGKFDALGIGDGSMNPACSLGVCAPTKVDGMTDGETDEGDGDDGGEEEFKKQLADVKASATEDGYKVIETLLTKQQERHDAQLKDLQDKFDKVTESEETLKTWKEKEEGATKEALIAKLPKETLDTLGVKPEDKSLDELRELVSVIEAVAGPGSGDDLEQTDGDGKPKKPKTAAPQAVPPVADDQAAADEAARAHNKKVKAKYQKSALLQHDN